MVAHGVDDGLDRLGQEGPLDPEHLAKAGRPAHDHAQDVGAPLVPRHDAVGDEEGDGARMVGDDAVGRHVGAHGLFRVAGDVARPPHDGQEDVGIIVVVGALQDGGQPLSPLPVSMLGRGNG